MKLARRTKPVSLGGYSFTPSAGGPRQIEFRVHQKEGVPATLEIFLVTRKVDGAAQDPKSVRMTNFMAEAAPAWGSVG